mgnify:CR=1 FL=1
MLKEALINSELTLDALRDLLSEKVAEVNWTIHESEAYYQGRYIHGEVPASTSPCKITIEITDPGSYELAFQGDVEQEAFFVDLEAKIIDAIR